MGAEHQKKKELKLKKHWTRRIPFRKRNQLYRSHFRVFLLDASVYSMFFLLPISITLRFSRTDDIVKPSWAASAVPNTSQHGLGSISLKGCHVAMSQNQSQSKSLTSKICWCFLITIQFHFALCQVLFRNWMWTECHVIFIAIVSFWVILLAHKASIWLGFPAFAKLVMDRLVSCGGRWKQGLQNKTIRGQVVAIVGQCKTLHEFSFRSQRN